MCAWCSIKSGQQNKKINDKGKAASEENVITGPEYVVYGGLGLVWSFRLDKAKAAVLAAEKPPIHAENRKAGTFPQPPRCTIASGKWYTHTKRAS